jgi:hypothetical protein
VQFLCLTCREVDRRQISAVALLAQVADADSPVRSARRWPRRISPRPLRARANDCFDGPGPVLRSNGTRRRNKTQSPKRASRRGTEVHVRCSSPRRTARGQYDAGAIRHSVGGKVAGDTRLWKCCNPDTSGGKWWRQSRDYQDPTFCRLPGITLFADRP